MYDVFFFLIIRRPPRSTLDRSSAASDVYKRQLVIPRMDAGYLADPKYGATTLSGVAGIWAIIVSLTLSILLALALNWRRFGDCLLYTSDAADERSSVDLGGGRLIKKKKRTVNQRNTGTNN